MGNSFLIDNQKKCYLNGQELKDVLNVDLKNINAMNDMEVTITLHVDNIDVKFKGIFRE